MAQLVSAIYYIHSLKIIHRDLKPSNIFITSDGRLKLGDFGISKLLEKTNDVALTQIGTPLYMCPEVCENHPYTNKSDIWSLGCIVYELATFEKPFMAGSLIALAFKIIDEKPKEIGERYSKFFKDLVDSMMQKLPAYRISAKELMNLLKIPETPAETAKLSDFEAESSKFFQGFNSTLGSETVVNIKKVESVEVESYEDDFESVIFIKPSENYEEDFEINL